MAACGHVYDVSFISSVAFLDINKIDRSNLLAILLIIQLSHKHYRLSLKGNYKVLRQVLVPSRSGLKIEAWTISTRNRIKKDSITTNQYYRYVVGDNCYWFECDVYRVEDDYSCYVYAGFYILLPPLPSPVLLIDSHALSHLRRAKKNYKQPSGPER